MYSVGKQWIPLFAVCGEMWEILNPDGEPICVVSGPKTKAEELVDKHLNSMHNTLIELGEHDHHDASEN